MVASSRRFAAKLRVVSARIGEVAPVSPAPHLTRIAVSHIGMSCFVMSTTTGGSHGY